MYGNLIARGGLRPSMPWWRSSEDYAFAPEWKKTLVGFVISIGIVLLFAGLTILAIAALTEFTYQNSAMPSDVQSLLGATRQTSVAIIAVGGGLVAIGYIVRH